jgi:telomerase reverse transcriptase
LPLSNLAMNIKTVKEAPQAADRSFLPPPKRSHQPIKVSVEPRRPSEIRFVRHRMFYAKAALNGKANVRLGLRHIHVLNRYPDLSSFEQSVHIAKYVFPRQFTLHNAFTSTVDTRETTQAFKDYTLREQEITLTDERSKRNAKFLPKRLRGGPIEVVEEMRKRHAKLSYIELLRKYCPVDGSCNCEVCYSIIQASSFSNFH